MWWLPKPLKIFIESIFYQFWGPAHVTSKLMSICVNLIMSNNFLWTFSIVQLYDYLTSFLKFEIILTHYLNHLSSSQGYFCLIRCNTNMNLCNPDFSFVCYRHQHCYHHHLFGQCKWTSASLGCLLICMKLLILHQSQAIIVLQR